MRVATLFVVALLALVAIDVPFVVSQWQQVIITRFGEPVREAIREPGLHFKLPLMEKIHRFDKRFLEWDGKVTEVQTKGKVPILVDTYARWRIADPLMFFQRLQNETRALGRIDGILNGATRDAVARYELQELVRSLGEDDSGEGDSDAAAGDAEADERTSADDEVAAAEALALAGIEPEDMVELEPIRFGRGWIRTEIVTVANPQLAQLGIELLDVQFKRINYIEDVRRAVYERMISERNRIADRYRSEGEGEALRIRGDKERELKKIGSEAYREAQAINGEADAAAIEIYARAYDQSSDSRAFYEFLKTMETYRSTFDEETWLMLSTEGDFFRFLENSGG